MLAMYLAVLDNQSSEEQFKDVYNTYKRLVYHTAYKLWAIRIWQKMYCKRCFCTLPKIFLKFIEKTVTNSPLISLVVVEAVHMICFANNEKNCWKMSQTNQMPLRCRMMQQLAPITLNV